MASLDFVIMTIQHSNGNVVARDLLVQLDPKNEDWKMDRGGLTPDDAYDLYSIGWISPVPLRSDYFVDQLSGTRYNVYGNPRPYGGQIECQVTRYGGVTP